MRPLGSVSEAPCLVGYGHLRAAEARRSIGGRIHVGPDVSSGATNPLGFRPRMLAAGTTIGATLGHLWDATAMDFALRRTLREPFLAALVVESSTAQLPSFLDAFRDIHRDVPCLVVKADLEPDLCWSFGVETARDNTPLEPRLAAFGATALHRARRILEEATAWAARWSLSPREAELLLRLANGVRHRKLPEAMGLKRASVVTLEGRLLTKSRLKRIDDAVVLVSAGVAG